MSITQRQEYCRECRALRLHQQTSQDCPHILHLLITIFLIGLWAPVWIIHAIIAANSSGPFLCTHCGQAAGAMTRGEVEEEIRRAHTDYERKQADKRIAKAEKGKRRRERSARQSVALAGFINSIPSRLFAAWRWYDDGLRSLAGQGNDMVYKFLLLLSGFLVAGVAVLTVVSLLT